MGFILKRHVRLGLIVGIVGAGADYLIEGQAYSAVKAGLIFGFGAFVIARGFAVDKNNLELLIHQILCSTQQIHENQILLGP
jgi:hypothetical protein